MRKKSILLFLLMIILSSTAWAKEVTVDGAGADRESALRDARRIAVEQVVGTFVDSRTLIENYAVALDNIYTKSSGFVGRLTPARLKTKSALAPYSSSCSGVLLRVYS